MPFKLLNLGRTLLCMVSNDAYFRALSSGTNNSKTWTYDLLTRERRFSYNYKLTLKSELIIGNRRYRPIVANVLTKFNYDMGCVCVCARIGKFLVNFRKSDNNKKNNNNEKNNVCIRTWKPFPGPVTCTGFAMFINLWQSGESGDMTPVSEK